jgi:hypothetical protein
MRALLFLLMAIVLFTQIACSKLTHNEMVVVRDCTGTYLRANDKDYLVCNEDKLEAYVDGAKVSVKYDRIKDCDGSNKVICMMAHEHEGLIEVISIN